MVVQCRQQEPPPSRDRFGLRDCFQSASWIGSHRRCYQRGRVVGAHNIHRRTSTGVAMLVLLCRRSNSRVASDVSRKQPQDLYHRRGDRERYPRRWERGGHYDKKAGLTSQIHSAASSQMVRWRVNSIEVYHSATKPVQWYEPLVARNVHTSNREREASLRMLTSGGRRLRPPL